MAATRARLCITRLRATLLVIFVKSRIRADLIVPIDPVAIVCMQLLDTPQERA